MSYKCPSCGLVNFATAADCSRCKTSLDETVNIPSTGTFHKSLIIKRIGIFLFAATFTLSGFYISLIVSAKPISREQNETVQQATSVLVQKGFEREATLLTGVTVFRSTDNWLNSSVEKENAYA